MTTTSSVDTVIDTAVPAHIRDIWDRVELIKRLSDGLIKIGPWGIGLDGLLAFLPGANLAYGLGAGGLLLMYAVRAQASKVTIAKMVACLAVDNGVDAIPLLGWAADVLFRGEQMAGAILQKDIEARYGPMGAPRKRWWRPNDAPVGDAPVKVGEGSAIR